MAQDQQHWTQFIKDKLGKLAAQSLLLTARHEATTSEPTTVSPHQPIYRVMDLREICNGIQVELFDTFNGERLYAKLRTLMFEKKYQCIVRGMDSLEAAQLVLLAAELEARTARRLGRPFQLPEAAWSLASGTINDDDTRDERLH